MDNVARPVAEGRMAEHGLSHVEATKADGCWDRAYKSGKDLKISQDFQAAVDLSPKAKEMLTKLTAQNRFALAFRVHNLKTEAGRAKAITKFGAMLERDETIYPQKQK